MQPRLRENDWLLASDGMNSGMVPANYIRVLGTRKGKPKTVSPAPTSEEVMESAIQDMPTPHTDPVSSQSTT